MQDDLGQKLKSETLEKMLKIAHDLENLEQQLFDILREFKKRRDIKFKTKK